LGLGLLVSACGPKSGQDANSALPADVAEALRGLPDAEVLALGKDFLPTFIHGVLGKGPARLDAGKADEALSAVMDPITPVFRLQNKDIQVIEAWTDAAGFAHARYRQRLGGLEVVGGDLTVHMNPRSEIYAVHGTARGAAELKLVPTLDALDALAWIAAATGQAQSGLETPTLVVKETPRDQALHLAWASAGPDAEGAGHQYYLDAHTGELLSDEPDHLEILARTIFDAKQGQSLPGAKVRGENDAPSNDSDVDAAFENLGRTWLCFHDAFGRDSVDNKGLPLDASVHYGQNYGNAYWTGKDRRMVFGDGDGEQLGPLALASDVVTHEITHGVVQFSAALIYQDESGAMNEAFADIMAAYCDARSKGHSDADSYLVGELVWTPKEPGDALRYMSEPTRDGASTGWWPNRGNNYWDHGSVHTNSGIANLAFYLLAEGGTNPEITATPEGPGALRVPGIGIDRAGAIFYRALTQYLTSHADFAGARAATKRAALDLEGRDTAAIVDLAWDAVGVPKPEAPEGPDQRLEACDDGKDNDDNGYIDCADPACAFTGTCSSPFVNGEGGIMLSELMANPSSVADPKGEWFEIHNWTSAAIDLAGYTIESPLGGPHRISRSVLVPARGFSTFAYSADPALGFRPDYVYGPSQIRLSNRRDEIRIQDRAGNIVTSLIYGQGDQAWLRPELGRSMALEGAYYPAIGPVWRQSEAPAFNPAGERGSPGRPNVSGIATQAGEMDLVISEIHFDPIGLEPDGEWIELLALNWKQVSIDGLTLSSTAQSTVLSAPGLLLGAGDRVLLCRNPAFGPAGCLPYGGLRLANDSDFVELSTDTEIVSRVSYSFNASLPAPSEGRSLELDEARFGWLSASDAMCESLTPWRDGFASPGSAGQCHAVAPPAGQ